MRLKKNPNHVEIMKLPRLLKTLFQKEMRSPMRFLRTTVLNFGEGQDSYRLSCILANDSKSK